MLGNCRVENGQLIAIRRRVENVRFKHAAVAAFGNGITLVVLVYATANVSGGHLNPAVTFAQCLTGHSSWKRGGLYIVAQLLGGIWGALVQVRRQTVSCTQSSIALCWGLWAFKPPMLCSCFAKASRQEE